MGVRGFGAAPIDDAAGAVLAEQAGQHESHRLISRSLDRSAPRGRRPLAPAGGYRSLL